MATKEQMRKIGRSNVRSSKVYERRVKNLLTEWTGKEFRRRRVEGRGDDVKVVEGVADVIPVEGEIHFAIEAKKEKDFSLDALMASPETAVFTKWWHQCCYDAKLLSEKSNEKKLPMLFFKPIPNWDWVAVAQSAFDEAVLLPHPDVTYDVVYRSARANVWFPTILFDAYAYLGKIEKNIAHSSKNKVMYPLELEPCYLCRWRDFATNVDPSSIFCNEDE